MATLDPLCPIVSGPAPRVDVFLQVLWDGGGSEGSVPLSSATPGCKW